MSEFTPEEIEGIVNAISQDPPSDEQKNKIPLRPQGSYGTIAKVGFTPAEGEKPRALSDLTEKELSSLETLNAHIEVRYGKTTLKLKELAALEKDSLILLDDLCDDLVNIYVNGLQIGRGEIVAVDGKFGVKIVSFTKTP